MKIKRVFAKDMRQGIRRVREELGEDAVILSNRKVDDGVEIVVGIDYDEAALNNAAKTTSRSEPVIANDNQMDIFSSELSLPTPIFATPYTLHQRNWNHC